MQLLKQLPPKTARRTGIILFFLSCLTFVAALALPFVSLPISGTIKAGLITTVAVLGELAFAASLTLLGREFIERIKSFVSFSAVQSGLFFPIAGLVVWAVVTVLLRYVGQYVLIPGNTPLTISAFAGVAVLMIVLMTALYRAKHVRGPERLAVATLFALPGMLLDAGTVLFFSDVFPMMRPDADALFAAWLFWGYSVVLMTGLVWPNERNERN